MQKIKALCANFVLLLAVSSSASAQTPGAEISGHRKHSLNTVNELLKLENAKALNLAKKDAQAQGFAQETSSPKEGAGTYTPPPQHSSSIQFLELATSCALICYTAACATSACG